MSKNIPIITDTDRLSAVADAILARAGNPKLTKNTVLNAMASALVGTKTNWGGLKAMTSPVHATTLDYAAVSTAPEHDEDEPPLYGLLGSLLVFPMPHPITGADHKLPLDVAEIPALQASLFGKDGAGEYTSKYAHFENMLPGQISITMPLYDGAQGEISIDAAAFARFLKSEHEAILAAIIEDGGVGENLHDAFITVAEGEADDEMLFDIVQEFPRIEEIVHEEGSDANALRITKACRDATWLFLAGASEHGERRTAIQYGPKHELINVVIDYESSLLADALRDAFEDESSR